MPDRTISRAARPRRRDRGLRRVPADRRRRPGAGSRYSSWPPRCIFYIYLTPRQIAGQVPGARHALPDRLPDRPGALHRQHRVHQLRRRPPRQQGRGDRRHPDRLGEAGRPARPSTPCPWPPRRPGHRRLVFLLVDPTPGRLQSGDRGRPAPADAGRDRRRGGTDHRGRRLHRAQPRPGQPRSAEEILAFAVPTARRRDPGHRASPGPTTAQATQSTTRAATASPTAPPARCGPPTTATGLLRRPPTANGSPRAGRSPSASATSPGCSPTPHLRAFLRHAGLELRLRDRLGAASPSPSASAARWRCIADGCAARSSTGCC